MELLKIFKEEMFESKVNDPKVYLIYLISVDFYFFTNFTTFLNFYEYDDLVYRPRQNICVDWT